jgi:hypothetical protein
LQRWRDTRPHGLDDLAATAGLVNNLTINATAGSTKSYLVKI